MAVVGFCVLVVGMIALAPALVNVSDLSRLMPGNEPNGPTLLSGVFTYQQQRPLSCEYASVYIATSLAGHPVSEYEIEAMVPHSPNPHWGYRGDIMGEWGNTVDYGVYNEPLAEGLSQLGVEAVPYYATSREELTRELDAGRPVIVWLGLWGDAGTIHEFSDNGTRYQLTTGMHVMVAYGYDDQLVYITDPGKGVYKEYLWDDFMTKWNVMDGMALSIHR